MHAQCVCLIQWLIFKITQFQLILVVRAVSFSARAFHGIIFHISPLQILINPVSKRAYGVEFFRNYKFHVSLS